MLVPKQYVYRRLQYWNLEHFRRGYGHRAAAAVQEKMVAHCAEHGWPREHGSAEHCVNYFSAASAEARVHMFWYKVEKWEIYRAQPDKHPMEVEYGEAFVDAHVPAMEMAGKARTHINERYPDDATDDDPVTPEEFARIIARSERIRYGLPLMAEKMFGRIH